MKGKCCLLVVLALLSWETLAALAPIRISDVVLEKSSAESARLIVKYEGNLQVPPDLALGANLLQITLGGARIGARLEKQVNVGGENFDSSLVAFQDDQDHVKVKLVLPFKASDLEQKSSITVKSKEIFLDFPLKATNAPSMEKKNTRKQLKTENNYDESFLNKLLGDKEIKDRSAPVKAAVSPKLEELEKKLLGADEVKNTLASPGRESMPFKGVEQEKSAPSTLRYAGKFGVFLALVLGLFFVVVHFFKKGALSKGKLGFLSSTPVITTLSTTYIGPKRSLMLVKVYNQVFLLGCSEAGISILSEIDEVPGLLKEGEKNLTGKNFDTDLEQMDDLSGLEEKIKIKDNIEISSDAVAKKKLPAPAGNRSKFSDELKKKVKGLRPMQ